MCIRDSFNSFEPCPAARMQAASATEGVPISLSTTFDGFGVLIEESSSDVKNFIGKFFSFEISKIACSSFLKSTVAKPAIDNGDKLLVVKKFCKESSINSLLVFRSQPKPIHKVGGCQVFL